MESSGPRRRQASAVGRPRASSLHLASHVLAAAHGRLHFPVPARAARDGDRAAALQRQRIVYQLGSALAACHRADAHSALRAGISCHSNLRVIGRLVVTSGGHGAEEPNGSQEVSAAAEEPKPLAKPPCCAQAVLDVCNCRQAYRTPPTARKAAVTSAPRSVRWSRSHTHTPAAASGMT
jgi:hypothetical protein